MKNHLKGGFFNVARKGFEPPTAWFMAGTLSS